MTVSVILGCGKARVSIDQVVAIALAVVSVLCVSWIVWLVERYKTKTVKPAKMPGAIKQLANTITRTRIALTFVAIIVWCWLPLSGAVLYVLVSVTDFLDGRAARRLGQVSDWGKLWDPRADKILTWSGMACIGTWSVLSLNFYTAAIMFGVLIITVVRDVDVMRLRSRVAKKVDVAAKSVAKLKTALQMTALCLFFFMPTIQTYFQCAWHIASIIAEMLLILAAVLTVVSWFEYRRAYRR